MDDADYPVPNYQDAGESFGSDLSWDVAHAWWTLYISYRRRDGTHRTCQLTLEPPDLEDTYLTRIWTPGCHTCRLNWSARSHFQPYYEYCQDALLFSMYGWMLGSRDKRRFGCESCLTSALAGLVVVVVGF